jgi:hypothetical protein
MIPACQAEPVAPGADRTIGSSYATTVGAPNILTVAMPQAWWQSFGINDRGWVFTYTNLGGGHLVAWRTPTAADTFTVLPSYGGVNSNGQYVSATGHFLVNRELWALSDGGDGSRVWNLVPITLPADWRTTFINTRSLNDGLTVVGDAQHPSRSVTDRKGATIYYATPFAWTPENGADSLRLPAAPPGCKYTHVYAEEINNSGTIVGYGEQEGSSKANCVTRALIWRSRAARADTLPRSPVIIAGFPKSVTPDKPLYHATEINDRGDIAGFWRVPGAAVALRWTAPTGGGAYSPPEQLAGNYPIPVDMDECGRVMIRESDWVGSVSVGSRAVWDRSGGVTSLPIPGEYRLPYGDAIRNGVAVTTVDIVALTNNEKALIAWTLSPCP